MSDTNNTHTNLVTAAEGILAKIHEFFSHKDLQCMAAIAQIHGYQAKLPSLSDEVVALEASVKASKDKIKEEAKADLTKVIEETGKVVDFPSNQ